MVFKKWYQWAKDASGYDKSYEKSLWKHSSLHSGQWRSFWTVTQQLTFHETFQFERQGDLHPELWKFERLLVSKNLRIKNSCISLVRRSIISWKYFFKIDLKKSWIKWNIVQYVFSVRKSQCVKNLNCSWINLKLYIKVNFKDNIVCPALKQITFGWKTFHPRLQFRNNCHSRIK